MRSNRKKLTLKQDSLRLLGMKHCVRCATDLPLKSFSIDKSNNDGLLYKCKSCASSTSGATFSKRPSKLELENNLAQGVKKCFTCKEVKPLQEFAIGSKYTTGRNSKCRKCYSIRRAEYTKYKVIEYKYNLPKEDFISQLKSQNNCCYICNNNFPSESHAYVDHDHATGNARKLLCQNCNTTLGMSKENTTSLAKSIEYLIKHKDNVFKPEFNDCKKYYKTNDPDYGRRVWLRKKYDISLETYNNMKVSQGNSCEICSISFLGKEKIVVDHNHKTKAVRGLLCHSCNLALGFAKESPMILQNCINYLAEHATEAA